MSSWVIPASVPVGGTGLTTLTDHNVLLGSGTEAITPIAPSTAGRVLTSNGASADPSFQDVFGSVNTVIAGGSPTISVAGTWYDTGSTFVVPSSGDYLVIAKSLGSVGSTTGTNTIEYRIRDVTGGATLGEGRAVYKDTAGLGMVPVTLFYIGALVSGRTVRMEVSWTTTGTASSKNSFENIIGYVKLSP